MNSSNPKLINHLDNSAKKTLSIRTRTAFFIVGFYLLFFIFAGLSDYRQYFNDTHS